MPPRRQGERQAARYANGPPAARTLAGALLTPRTSANAADVLIELLERGALRGRGTAFW